MTDAAICVQQLTKTYADRSVVDRFDLTVPIGIVLSLLGPNAAGPSTDPIRAADARRMREPPIYSPTGA